MNNTKTNIIRVSGKNIDNFFQNLITNDINLLTTKNTIYTALLTPQGKFLHDFFIIREDQGFLIECSLNKKNNLINELKKYDIRNEIKISTITELKTNVILKEDLAKETLEKINQNTLQKNNNQIFFEDPRSKNFLVRFWQHNKDKINILNSSNLDAIESKRIELKIPNTEIDMIENKSFILNYNFENLNAISFEKGCFIGQENTARQKYRGNIKFSLQTIKIISGPTPNINENIFFNERKIGTFKSSMNSYSLCLLKNDLSLQKNKKIKTDNGILFEII